MAASLRTEGTWVAANATTQTVTLGTHATGDMLLLRVGFKHATMPTTVTVGTAGWTKLGEDNSGTGASSNGGGDVQVAAFYKEAASAAETNPVITFNAGVTAATPSAACCQVYQKAATDVWVTPVGDGAAISVATNFSATIGTHVSATSGDLIDAFVVTNDNTTLTVPTFTQTGLTLNTVVESPAAALSSATSNDISADGCYRIASAGTSSAAAVVTGTNSVADIGEAWTTRLRVTGVTGTGAITVPSATVAGTGSHAETVTGTGAITVGAPTVVGTGAETFTATGAIAIPAATVAGTGAEVFTATGAVTVPAVTIAGTGAEAFTATGAITGAAPTVSGTGDHSESATPVTGTGAITVPAATVAGSGTLTFTATGAIGVPAATVVGSGAIVLTGSGSIVIPVATIVGSGSHFQNATGTGAIVVGAPTVAGTGTFGDAQVVGGPPPVAIAMALGPSASASAPTPSAAASHPTPGS